MIRHSSSFHVVLAAVLVLALMPVRGMAQDDSPDVLMLVNTSSNQVQGMAMSMASHMARQDHAVDIVLCGEAAQLGLQEYIPEALAPRDVSAKEIMQEAMSFGASVEVCHLYLPNSGYHQYTEEDLLNEVTVNDPEELAQTMARDDVRVITY
ncbi:DsrE family protein [Aquisalimonas lutea]|uniref:DsrE family protein n=1 Tax=Aquisalimonas lutea TaxID=1327750 RepID=UPI0025B2AE7C|nr:DsrE family protein [Aquisalimonas lutea]MDN3517483.1 DsrE family protein [Aquisalimonas lutea]